MFKHQHIKAMSNSKLYKGSLVTIILKLLSKQEEMYGYEITQKVKKMTNGALNITEGALYPALHKLEAQGVLSVKVIRVDNRLRKYYSLTEQGKKEAISKLDELAAYIANMQVLLDPKLSV